MHLHLTLDIHFNPQVIHGKEDQRVVMMTYLDSSRLPHDCLTLLPFYHLHAIYLRFAIIFHLRDEERQSYDTGIKALVFLYLEYYIVSLIFVLL